MGRKNGEEWKYGINDVRVLVYPTSVELDDLSNYETRVSSILSNRAIVRSGVVNIPGIRSSRAVLAIALNSYEDFVKFNKHVLGKTSKVGFPESLRGALSLEEIFEREENNDRDVISCDSCEVVGEGFIPVPEGTYADLQESNVRLEKKLISLNKRYEELRITNKIKKKEKTALSTRVIKLEEALRSEEEKTKATELCLSFAQEPLIRKLGLVERISRRIDTVTELLDGREISELYEQIEMGENAYVSERHGVQSNEIQRIQMTAANPLNLMEGYDKAKALAETAKKTISYINGLAEIFDEEGNVVDKEGFRKAFRGMPLALSSLAFRTYENAREGVSDAEKAIAYLERVEDKYKRTKALSERINETRNEYNQLVELSERIESIVGNEKTIPSRLEFLGETEEDYRLKVTIPVLKDQEELLSKELRLFALSPVLSEELKGIENVGEGEGELNNYIFKVDKSNINNGEDLALLLYRMGNTMTKLTTEFDFGKLGYGLNIECRFDAGRLRSLEEEVVVVEPRVEAVEEVVEVESREENERKLMSYEEYYEQLNSRASRYGLRFGDIDSFGIGVSKKGYRELKHVASMEMILAMVEQGIIYSTEIKSKVRTSLIKNYDLREIFPGIYDENNSNWRKRSNDWKVNLLNNDMIARSQEKPFGKFNPGFWIPRESCVLVSANYASENYPNEVYAKGNILPVGFYLARNAFDLFRKVDRRELVGEGLSYEQIWENVLDNRNLSHVICLGDDQGTRTDIFEQTLQDFPTISREEFDESILRLKEKEYVINNGDKVKYNKK